MRVRQVKQKQIRAVLCIHQWDDGEGLYGSHVGVHSRSSQRWGKCPLLIHTFCDIRDQDSHPSSDDYQRLMSARNRDATVPIGQRSMM